MCALVCVGFYFLGNCGHALVFVYIWAGPHHLLNTALPEWLQTLGILNGLFDLAWCVGKSAELNFSPQR